MTGGSEIHSACQVHNAHVHCEIDVMIFSRNNCYPVTTACNLLVYVEFAKLVNIHTDTHKVHVHICVCNSPDGFDIVDCRVVAIIIAAPIKTCGPICATSC